MATAQKKKTTSKAKSTKAAPKHVAAKVATKKPPVKHAAKKRLSKKYPKMRSFHVAKDVPPFTTFRFSRQTVYWLILIAFISVSQLWILSLQLQIATLIDQQQSTIQSTVQK
ncbi:MAG TPA: hypothetical protein VN081_00775 [Dongiaceae bacterium]|nr:hypothetical protein [Dongiaceae bacterium]